MLSVNPRAQLTPVPAYLSLALMPGLTITSVIVVDNPGSSAMFAILKHSQWNGFTPADWVFPAFLSMIGVEMMLSHLAKEDAGQSQQALLFSLLWRSLYLIAIGLLLNTLFLHPWSTMPVFGVLQRVGLCLAFGSLLLSFTRSLQRRWVVLSSALLICLIGYWLLLRYTPVPSFGIPGHGIPQFDPTINLPDLLDRKLFAHHLVNGTSDPNGLLTTIPALGTFLTGMLIGLWLRTGYTPMRKAIGLIGTGCLSLLIGGLWSRTFPINMHLWTSSYVLWAAGWTMLVLALLFVISDVLQIRGTGWSILLVFGTNAMASFILASGISTCIRSFHVDGWNILSRTYPSAFSSMKLSESFSLLYSLFFTAGCWILMRQLYKHKIVLEI